MKHPKRIQKNIAFFGHFDSSNFGNESTLQAILYHLRQFHQDAEIICITTGPEAIIASYKIKAIPIAGTLAKSQVLRNPTIRLLRKTCIWLPSECYRWIKGVTQLRRTDMLIIPGTGLLTDAYGLKDWGPYSLLKWSLIAKFCRCKILFVSVGAGPIYGGLGRYFVKAVLSLADFRSYRDYSTVQQLRDIGFCVDNDLVYPDLAFSLPEAVIPRQDTTKRHRSVVGLGVMHYAGRYSIANPSDTIHLNYSRGLVILVKWLLSRDYDVRLLIGDAGDNRAKREFKELLRKQLLGSEERHIIDEPIGSVQDLLSQISKTDFVVATRFHNVILAMLCNKPVISISFHHKCASLMSAMGLSDYCLNINDLKADELIATFRDLERNNNALKQLMSKKVGEFRETLDEQYKRIFDNM